MVKFRCERAGCEREATIRMGQESPWNMLFSGPDYEANLCEKDAKEAEQVGGIRLGKAR